jgi:hypothetical protein
MGDTSPVVPLRFRYYHILYDEEDGYEGGRSTCEFWYTGTIVSNVDHERLQGCN